MTPPHFNVGVSLEPVYPSLLCSYFDFGVDGPSVQSTPTQDELEVGHYALLLRRPEAAANRG